MDVSCITVHFAEVGENSVLIVPAWKGSVSSAEKELGSGTGDYRGCTGGKRNEIQPISRRK